MSGTEPPEVQVLETEVLSAQVSFRSQGPNLRLKSTGHLQATQSPPPAAILVADEQFAGDWLVAC